MWIMALVLIAIIAVIILILLVGTGVKIGNGRIKTGFRTYTGEEIMRHWFSVEVCYKSPAEYDAELNVFTPRMGAPPSHRKKWAVELVVFDNSGRYIRRHLFQKPNERAAEKLAMELERSLASRLKPSE
ncbi:MAG: hypothetical protein ACOYJB_07210 [Christensenellaceae bacterium]|jgi:hypothetical protein